MRNRDISPALKHDNRLNRSVVRNQEHKRPNALRHGLFANAVILPGEDWREFRELLIELVDEWTP